MMTMFEYLWEMQRGAILYFLERGLLSKNFVAAMLRGPDVARSESKNEEGHLEFHDYERLMRHDAYRRVRGAIRQIRWA